MTRRLLAIAFIYICTAAAWLVLGATIFQRTSASDGHLRSRVGSTWGTRHTQQAPAAFIERLEPVRTQATRPRPDGTETVTEPSGLVAAPAPGTHATLERTRVPLSLERTRASVAFDLDHRQKGLLWYSTYQVDFEGAYRFRNVTNSDFADIDFPENALSPTEKAQAGNGWALRWRYTNLLSGFEIGMAMPQKLQPGPLAGQIALFAPVSLLFFFAVMFMIATIRGIPLHPMNYAFLAAGFFAFHILLAYLVDHVSIHLAFLVASVTSIALVVSYLRLVVGPRFAFREAAAAQFIYLVLFSYAFFFKGFTGLAITIGSVITLFVAMQLTGRIDWAKMFASAPAIPQPSTSAPIPGHPASL